MSFLLVLERPGKEAIITLKAKNSANQWCVATFKTLCSRNPNEEMARYCDSWGLKEPILLSLIGNLEGS